MKGFKTNLQKNLLDQRKTYSLRAIFWFLAILLGALQVWAFRYNMDPDGTSYLDIGDAYLRGEWDVAINAIWSPLLSWILGLALSILKPSPYWEFPVVKLVSFLIYLVTLLCFEFFLREFIFYYQEKVSQVSPNRSFRVPKWVWVVLGYTLFIWSSLHWIGGIEELHPDMCLAAFVYLASGIVLRARVQSRGWFNFILLGVVLGLGYLAKTVMFPLAFVFLLVGIFSVGNLRRALPRALVALLVFTIIVTPFIGALSLAKGRLTFGDAGKLNYAWYVNQVPPLPPLKDKNRLRPVIGTYEHPPRKIFDNYPVYEFGTTVGGSYPYWYDPSYWHEGLKPKFDLVKQLRASKRVFISYYKLFLGDLIFIYLILVCVGGRFRLAIKDLIENWRILIPAAAGLGIYLLVGITGWHLQRYTAPFVMLLFAGVFSSVRLPDSQQTKRWVAGITIATLIFVGGSLSLQASKDLVKGFTSEHIQWQVADGLNQLGIRAGEKVAILMRAPSSKAFPYWARLGRFKVVAEIAHPTSFWATDAATRSEIYKAIEKTGARAIVQLKFLDSASTTGWQRIGNTDYYVYFLPR